MTTSPSEGKLTIVAKWPLVVLAIGMLLAVSLFLGTGPNVYALSPGPSVEFTKDAVIVKDDSNPKADGMSVTYKRDITVIPQLSFTEDDLTVGTGSAPPDADGFKVTFNTKTCTIFAFVWTKKGKPLPVSVTVPDFSNDLHFTAVQKIKGFKWTVGGKNKETVGPKKADALDFFCEPNPP